MLSNLKVNACGIVAEQGFYQGTTKKGVKYCFFCIQSYSNKKWRNIPCVVEENYFFNDIYPGMRLEITGDLTFVFSKRAGFAEMKINVLNFKQIKKESLSEENAL